jgi:hypothetical protein
VSSAVHVCVCGTYALFSMPVSVCAVLQGTAATEEEEFSEVYGLSVVRVPPHKPSIRIDHPTQLMVFSEVGAGAGGREGRGWGVGLARAM